MKRALKISLMTIILKCCAICAASAFAASPVNDLSITNPGSQTLEAGNSGSFNVSFKGSGIEKVAVQPSGAGLSAKVINASWKPYPNTCSATVSITAASNFQGGNVAFLLINNNQVIKSQTIPINGRSTQKSSDANVNAAGATPPLTSAGLSQINVELSKVQASKNQNCIDQLTAYRDRFKKAMVGIGSHPGPMPQCQSGTLQTVTITTAPPTKVNDRMDFTVTTSLAVSRVVLAWDNGTATMTSTNGKNWSVSLKTSQLSPTNGFEEITVRAYPTNSMVAVTRTMNVGIESTTIAQNTTDDSWEKLRGKRMTNINSSAFTKQNNPFSQGQCTWYAHGRFLSVHNIRLHYDGGTSPGDAKKWLTNAHAEDKNGNSLIITKKSISDNCVAVSTSGGGGYGHVIFVEHINSKYVYYTEANVPRDDKLSADDGVLKRADIGIFIKDKAGYICKK